MATIRRFEEVEAWKQARQLAVEVYRVSQAGLFACDFGLRDQIRRIAVSVVSNIAEGFERDGDREFLQFLSLAKGSCGEVRSQLYVALDQGCLDPAKFAELAGQAEKASRLIGAFMTCLRRSSIRGTKFARAAGPT